MPENSGGAGGFSSGMRWAFERNHDWVWVMDDDVEALPAALENMLKYSDISRFIQFRREGPDGVVEIEGMWDLNSCECVMYGQDLSFRYSDRDWISVQWGCFEGALIHRDVMRKIGFPDPRYFIGGDDAMYGLQASFHTNVIYARPVALRRKLAQPVAPTRLSYYFFARNRFLHREHLQKLGISPSASMFWVDVAYMFAWSIKSVLGRPDRLSNMRSVLTGMRDGVRGLYGRPSWLR
jgi:hypothetical protein